MFAARINAVSQYKILVAALDTLLNPAEAEAIRDRLHQEVDIEPPWLDELLDEVMARLRTVDSTTWPLRREVAGITLAKALAAEAAGAIDELAITFDPPPIPVRRPNQALH